MIVGSEVRAWPLSCANSGMQPSRYSQPPRLNYRVCSYSVFLLVLSFMPTARAANFSMRPPGSPQAAAFARYIAALQERDPFAESGATAILIEAALPELYKDATLLAIRARDENGRSQYLTLQVGGDGTVVDQVIARYAALQKQFDNLPAPSIAITPANYNFRFAGKVNTGGTAAYVYHISPRKRRPGLVVAELWMDCGTGREIMLRGRILNTPSIGGRADFVRDTKLLNGSTYARITHLAIAVPRLGRGELVITEHPLDPEDEIQSPKAQSVESL